MYLVFSTLPHFAFPGRYGPEAPRQTGYSSDRASAQRKALEDQGVCYAMNDLPASIRRLRR